MKHRRHHNNDAIRQIKRGKTRDQVRAIAERLGVPYGRDARRLASDASNKAVKH